MMISEFEGSSYKTSTFPARWLSPAPLEEEVRRTEEGREGGRERERFLFLEDEVLSRLSLKLGRVDLLVELDPLSENMSLRV